MKFQFNPGLDYQAEAIASIVDIFEGQEVFRVNCDCEALIRKCADEIAKKLVVGKARFVFRTGLTAIDRGGVRVEPTQESTHVYDARDYELPDVVSCLQNETNLTRRTLVEIMQRSDRLQDFKNNPQKCIEQVAAIIQHQMRLFIVDGIKYEKIGDHEYFAQELFEENELYGYLSKNMLESKKSVYDHVVYDSDVEEEFARSFELSQDVKVYAKLPGWFKIETPLGSYNPDWAVLVEVDGQERLYFVVESKGRPIHGRPSPGRAGEDRLRPGTLQGPWNRGPVPSGEQLRHVYGAVSPIDTSGVHECLHAIQVSGGTRMCPVLDGSGPISTCIRSMIIPTQTLRSHQG